MYKYKISVIMAVYNVEPFLREAVDSVIAQSIGFENIQLILVDDGTPDNSGIICDEYAQKYPDNIVVVHKENGGVAAARNTGLDLAEGELINFLDSDDKMAPQTFLNVYNFYEKNKIRTDIVVVPMQFFDGEQGGHTLNYKFKKGSRVIDLDTEWNVCQLQSGATFINALCLKDLRFDTRLRYAEDAHLLQRVLANKCTMGVMADGAYMYRKRTTGAESAIQSSHSKKDWYLSYFEFFQKDIVRFYQEKYGTVPRFIQYVLMYDIQWRLRMEHVPEGVLTDEEREVFSSHIFGMLKYFDDDVIMAQRNLYNEYKVFALKKKYGVQTVQQRDNDIVLSFGNTIGAKLSQSICRMEFLKVEGDSFCLEGRVGVYAGVEQGLQFLVCVNGEEYPCESMMPEERVFSLDEPILLMCGFKGKIPLDQFESDDLAITIYLCSGGRKMKMEKLRYGSFFPVSDRYKNAYSVQNGWKITVRDSTINLQKVKPGQIRRCERALLWELWKNNKTGERKAVVARILRSMMLRFKRKPLWLVEDRARKAGDNGEAFFRYLRQNHPEIDTRFVISKDCPDYARMSEVGPVLEKDSFLHKLYMLISDYIISSHAEADVYNPFIGYSEPYRDILCCSKFVFLQHGITQNNLSDWLDRYNKNIYGFITAAKPEAQSILDLPYHYGQEQVWLTGFARFDRLYRAEEKLITVMPTWRRYLFGSCSRETKIWSIGNVFLQSDYLAFYNGLLNHPRLLEAVQKHGYKLAFFPHPNVQDHLDVFEKNDQVVFLEKETEYRDVYAKSNMIVSDYSSALFDFAYLRKPVIYTQFDQETFFSGAHTLERGYFDYERDGFGEVEYDLESTVDRLIEYMEHDCQLKDEYRRRIDNFFAFDDRNNCQRVYEKIMELEKNG